MSTSRRTLLKSLALGAGAAVLDPLVRQLDAQATGSGREADAVPLRDAAEWLPGDRDQSRRLPAPGSRSTARLDDRPHRRPSAAPVDGRRREIQTQGYDLTRGLRHLCQLPRIGRIGRRPLESLVGAGAYMAMNNNVPAATVDWALGNKLGGLFKNVCLGVTQEAGTSVVYDLSASGPGT